MPGRGHGRHAHFRQPWIVVCVPGYKALGGRGIWCQYGRRYVFYIQSDLWYGISKKRRWECGIFANHQYDRITTIAETGNLLANSFCKQPAVHGRHSLWTVALVLSDFPGTSNHMGSFIIFARYIIIDIIFISTWRWFVVVLAKIRNPMTRLVYPAGKEFLQTTPIL